MDGNEPRKGVTETRKKWLYELLDDMKRYKVGKKKKDNVKKKYLAKGKMEQFDGKKHYGRGQGEADYSKSKSG